MYFDSCIDSFILVFRDFKLKFYGLLIRNMNIFFELNKLKKRYVFRKLFSFFKVNIFYM